MPFAGSDAPLRADLLACVHCGLCLTACPTWRLDRNEADSPRGRIYLMRAVQEGRIELDADVVRHIDSCVGCRACETVCPAGVRFGSLLEATRSEVVRAGRVPRLRRLAAAVLFRGVLPHRTALRAVRGLTRAYQRSGVRTFLRRTGLTRLLPASLRVAEELLPDRAAPRVRPRAPGAPGGEPAPVPRGRVGFLRTCMMDIALPDVDAATRLVLERNGFEVVEPGGQSCCGALHLHAGRVDEARALARRVVKLFEKAGVERVVTNSAGCGSTLKDYGHLLAREPAWSARAEAFAARVRDVSEVLAAIPLARPTRPVPARVAYQDACHLAHAQRVRAEPRALLRALPAAELVELPHADWCCGSGGIYNLLNPATGDRLLADKVEAVRASGADVLAVANPGCALHIARGLRRAGLAVRVAHPVELLAEAYTGV